MLFKAEIDPTLMRLATERARSESKILEE